MNEENTSLVNDIHIGFDLDESLLYCTNITKEDLIELSKRAVYRHLAEHNVDLIGYDVLKDIEDNCIEYLKTIAHRDAYEIVINILSGNDKVKAMYMKKLLNRYVSDCGLDDDKDLIQKFYASGNDKEKELIKAITESKEVMKITNDYNNFLLRKTGEYKELLNKYDAIKED